MASIRNLKLNISKVEGPKCLVSISYDIHFSELEVAAGAAYHEEVRLRGDDVLIDQDLAMSSGIVRAESRAVHRSIRRLVSDKLLDEDPDIVVLGFVLRREDELYVRVNLTPFMAMPVKEDSERVRADFGLAAASSEGASE